MEDNSNYIYIYDSTLRDGSQARGIDFTVADKRAIAKELDALGVDYIEGGWPGANPKDDEFFRNPPELHNAKLTAFGMTRRAGRDVSSEPIIEALLATGCKHICIVGKSWDFHIEKALEISPAENKAMIEDSIKYLLKNGVEEVLFDAEHFFDGYKHNKTIAMEMIQVAYDAGARWIVLCDTNGGTMPHQIEEIVSDVTKHIEGKYLGIHCHNDTEQAVANSLAAVRVGVRQVQGTLNGIGERCGNANLVSVIPSLILKMGYQTAITEDKLVQLTRISRMLDDRLNRAPNAHAPYVGESAFAHKGGLHVSAMAKDTASYEHIPPEKVGNKRLILVSDKAGRSNIIASLKSIGLLADNDSAEDKYNKSDIDSLIATVKEREALGYAYEDARASFELMARRRLHDVPEFFKLESFRVLDERRWDSNGKFRTMSEATVKLSIGGERIMVVGEGNGPVNALDSALRNALKKHYPTLEDIRLTDYKVRILTPQAGTGAVTRVLIETSDGDGNSWNTIGVSANVIDASFMALNDSINYRLLKTS